MRAPIGRSRPFHYGTSAPATLPVLTGPQSPLNWPVVWYDDFTSFTQSTTTETATSATYSNYTPVYELGTYGQSQDLMVNAYRATQAGMSGPNVPFLSGGSNPFSQSGSILSITGYQPTTAQLTAMKTITTYSQYFPGGAHVRPAFTAGAIPIVSGALFPNLKMAYGYFEMNVQMPAAANGNCFGFWPAFWLNYLAGNFEPEIDMLELFGAFTGALTRYETTIHFGTSGAKSFSQVNLGIDLTAAFHTYSCLWTPNYIASYFDGSNSGLTNFQPAVVTTGTDANPLESGGTAGDNYLGPNSLLNVMFNLSFGPSPNYVVAAQLPATYNVDWIRVSSLGPQ